MRCHECGHAQDDGRFCGWCGAALVADGSDSTAGDHDSGTSGVVDADARLWVQIAGVAAVLVVAAVIAVSSRPDEVSDPGRVAVPTPDGVTATESEAATPNPSGSPLPTVFARPTGTMLLIDTGGGEATIVDLDTGRWAEVPLEEQRPGDQPFRLWPMGDSIVVGWGEIWAVTPGRDMEARHLGEATFFVPDADPNRVWLIDYEGGRVGQGVPTWTLVGGKEGEILHQAEGAEEQLAVRGIPSGLVLRSPDGRLSVYAPSTGEISDYEPEARYIVAAGPDQVVWCGENCLTLVSTRGDDSVRIEGHPGRAFHPDLVWLSHDGAYLAAVTWIDSEAHPVMAIYDALTGERLHETAPFAADDPPTGAWTADGQFIYLMPQGVTSGDPDLVVGRWTPQLAEQVSLDNPGIPATNSAFVTYPSCALASLFEGPATTAGCPSPNAAS